jgi:hypothetical protein
MNKRLGYVKVRIAAGMERTGDYKIWTLTFTEDIEDDEALRRWRDLTRKLGHIRYFRVLEHTKRGRPHIHAIVDSAHLATIDRIPNGGSLTEWLQKQSPEATSIIETLVDCGFGPITNIERVKSSGKGAANYLAKYLSKERSDGVQKGKHIRLFEGSRDWLPKRTRPSNRRGRTQFSQTNPGHGECMCGGGTDTPMNTRRRDEVWRTQWEGAKDQATEFAAARHSVARMSSRLSDLKRRRLPQPLRDVNSLKERKAYRDAAKNALRAAGYHGPLNRIDGNGTYKETPTHNAF